MVMLVKKTALLLLLVSMICLSGCYQMHSDDDLRTVPVTNNPNIIPQNHGRIPGVAI
jgi:hypothetical protein